MTRSQTTLATALFVLSAALIGAAWWFLQCSGCAGNLKQGFGEVEPTLAPCRAAPTPGAHGSWAGGGVNVIQQYLRLRLIDEMHIALSLVLLGSGERLFEGVNLAALGYACTKHQATARATHVVLARQ